MKIYYNCDRIALPSKEKIQFLSNGSIRFKVTLCSCGEMSYYFGGRKEIQEIDESVIFDDAYIDDITGVVVTILHRAWQVNTDNAKQYKVGGT